ncbi:MAG: asparagine synthase (glutamine-hydrolyzing) [Gemmatimonadaceae bacterium]
MPDQSIVCGIAGILTATPSRAEALCAAVERMTLPIAHRGPDDDDTWCDPAAGVAFGFRRLSILDLTPSGRQPMRSASGRFILVFNGEVFNHDGLRLELIALGHRFRGRSDTEVILAGFEEWGLVPAVRRFVGMFAFAVWDARERTISLARDRMGIKPLFVYAERGLITFGSELKALIAGPAFDRAIDANAVASYLRYLYVPAPRTIFRSAIKLLPGHILTLRDPQADLPASQPYWDAHEVARRGVDEPFEGSDLEAIDELERLLIDAVRLRMVADVPVGALLSGGIDSSTVVSLMQELSPGAVRTFTIGFDQPEHDEAAHAARIARHLGTEHTELHLTGHSVLDTLPRMPEIFDEPFGDPSQLPTFLVCELARRQVTVALTGDGGDELFAGYNRYIFGHAVLRRAGWVPGAARRVAAAAIGRVRPAAWRRAYGALEPALASAARQRLPAEKMGKVAEMFGHDTPAAMYRSLLSAWQDPDELVASGRDAPGTVDAVLGADAPAELLSRMLLADQLTYLPEDLLAKLDRVSMAVSLEARVPILDHRVVEFSWRLPFHQRIRGGRGKWILRQVLDRRIPRHLVDRPKTGFSVPIGQWLRGPLRPWAETLLSPESIARQGMLRPEPVRQAWSSFQEGKEQSALGLWAVLMLQAWGERWLH